VNTNQKSKNDKVILLFLIVQHSDPCRFFTDFGNQKIKKKSAMGGMGGMGGGMRRSHAKFLFPKQ